MTNTTELCQHCQGVVDSNAMVCPHCGREVQHQPTAPASPPSSEAESEPPAKIDAEAEAAVAKAEFLTRPAPPKSLFEFLGNQIRLLEQSLAWNEVWFFLMWGFLLLTFFIG